MKKVDVLKKKKKSQYWCLQIAYFSNQNSKTQRLFRYYH